MKALLVGLFCALTFGLTACSTSYTEAISHSEDTRGTISFKFNKTSSADVFLDGQYVGKVKDFESTEDNLVVTPGSHVIAVVKGKKMILNQKVFIGNSTNKVIVLP